MIYSQTFIKIVDNTGVKKILSIRILGSRKISAKIGDILIGVVKDVIPKSDIKKSDIVRVLIIRIHKSILRLDGSRILFHENAGILVTKENNPIGTRIFGPILKEIRLKGFTKIITLTSKIV